MGPCGFEGVRIDVDDSHVAADAREHRAQRTAGTADQRYAPCVERDQQAEDRVDVTHQAHAETVCAALIPASLDVRDGSRTSVADDFDFAERIGATREDWQRTPSSKGS